jgi:hypothetical protein
VRKHHGRQQFVPTASLLALLAGIALAQPVEAGNSIPVTIPVAVISVTVTSASPLVFGNCYGGNSTITALGFPNGICDTTGNPITITNTGAASNIQVQGTDANSGNGGTPWTLCSGSFGGVGSAAPACTGLIGAATVVPGPNQYAVNTGTLQHLLGTVLAKTPQCDSAFVLVQFPGACGASAGQSATELLFLSGPKSSTDGSASFTMTVTWTGVVP